MHIKMEHGKVDYVEENAAQTQNSL